MKIVNESEESLVLRDENLVVTFERYCIKKYILRMTWGRFPYRKDMGVLITACSGSKCGFGTSA